MALEKIYKDIDMSLKPDYKGDIRKKVNKDAINQHLKLLLLTEQDDIPFLNNVSADIRNLLFQPYTLHIKDTIDDLVRNIVTQFEPRIKIQSVDNESTRNSLTITLTYMIKQTRVVGEFQAVLKRVH